jgi:antitoxin VapB
LHIKDEKADRLARELAQATGESLDDAVTRALEERLARHRRPPKPGVEARRRAIMERVEQLAKLPVLDDRSADEIMGYDENGFPT